ncbi:MAG: hypothetical protein JXM79_05540 [Sedimentisphaerales bacterium]|nr:hypothetical protein [Sedimentisphaerales bacterium]
MKMRHQANIQHVNQRRTYRLIGRTPRRITEDIDKFCKELDSSGQPVFVRIELEPDAERVECIRNVHKKIMRDGGQIRFGWAIWEIPNIMIEAVYHAIWISPQGEPIDITPKKQENADRILFLEDSKDKYNDGLYFRRIDNVRKPLSGDPLVAEFIEMCEEIFEFEEKVSPGSMLHLEGQALECYKVLERRKYRLSYQICSRYPFL